MSRVLVIGGYGAFGARLSRRLAARGHRVLVAGRSPERVEAFCATLAEAEPVVLDRGRIDAATIADCRADLVIDAAGPFQGNDYRVPLACIAARVPYLDLADARGFVTGIGALDSAAREGGVAVISGASSVPALSGAVVRELAQGLRHVDAVEIVISTSNRASAGDSVPRAILSYVGQPVRVRSGGAWAVRHGWHDMRTVDLVLADGTGIRRRLVGIADVPDHDLVPAMLPGRPDTIFRAGTELGMQMRGLWLLGWLVRWSLVGSLAGAARWLMPLYRLTLGLGGDRSAMQVRLRAPGVERRWTLMASDGHGPEIPVMAAELLAEEILAGREAPGARDAARSLTLAQFEPLFAALAIRHETVAADRAPERVPESDSDILRTGNAFATAVVAATIAAVVSIAPLAGGSPLILLYVAIFAVIVAGVHAFGIGVPLYCLASRLWPLRWWNAALGGAVVGAAPFALVNAQHATVETFALSGWLALIGTAAGIAFWWRCAVPSHALGDRIGRSRRGSARAGIAARDEHRAGGQGALNPLSYTARRGHDACRSLPSSMLLVPLTPPNTGVGCDSCDSCRKNRHVQSVGLTRKGGHDLESLHKTFAPRPDAKKKGGPLPDRPSFRLEAGRHGVNP